VVGVGRQIDQQHRLVIHVIDHCQLPAIVPEVGDRQSPARHRLRDARAALLAHVLEFAVALVPIEQTFFNLGGRSYGWTQGISDNYNEATGSYNALQVVLNKRVSAGLSFLSHYTWSHAIDHESYEFAINSSIGRGNSYYNRRQAFVFAGNYDLPFGKGRQIAALDGSIQNVCEQNRAYYAKLLSSSMSIETPDAKLNDAFSWAEASVDQLRVETTPDHDEEALTAGFLGSGDSVRPGFGWFFGRDALWTIYALNSVGQFQTTRKEIEFLLNRQSPDGKILHEWSQTANLVDWKSLPYEYRPPTPQRSFPWR
jgi:hypothetical protein